MFKVVVTDYTFPDLSVEENILLPLGAQIQTAQCRTVEEVAELAKDADAVITQFAPVKADAIKAMQRARIIVRYGIGVDNVDLAAAAEKKIAVCNIPDYCIAEVADHTLAFVLALTRQVVPNALVIRDGGWAMGTPLAMMRTLRDMTVGIVAFGRIGREVVQRLNSFGSKVLVFDPIAPTEAITKAGARPASLDEVLKESDLISLHCPSTPQTRGMLDRKAFASMKTGVLLVNASRGDLIVTNDLIDALKEGKVAGAALDVTSPEPPPKDSPLRSMPQVIIHSHIASTSLASGKRLREGVAEHVARRIRGEKMINVVNGL